jgi:hypothetical protein
MVVGADQSRLALFLSLTSPVRLPHRCNINSFKKQSISQGQRSVIGSSTFASNYHPKEVAMCKVNVYDVVNSRINRGEWPPERQKAYSGYSYNKDRSMFGLTCKVRLGG